MKRVQYIFFLLFSSFMMGCISYNHLNNTLLTSSTPIPLTPKILDIPTYTNGLPYTYWNFAKKKESQLHIESPELSNDSLLLRIWITNPSGHIGQSHGLIEIKKDTIGWKGTLILMKVNFNSYELTETITEKKILNLIPKSNWNHVSDSLQIMKIDLLPTDDKIENYYTNGNYYDNNALTFSFEYSTKKEYRFYQYSNVYRVPDKFWQPKNVIEMLNLLDREFGWINIGKEYFK